MVIYELAFNVSFTKKVTLISSLATAQSVIGSATLYHVPGRRTGAWYLYFLESTTGLGKRGTRQLWGKVLAAESSHL